MAFVSTILCVDDDEDDLFFIREVIRTQNHSFHIEEAKNGLEAMNFLEASAAKNELPCLVIMDMNMPRMDGKQAISKMKENNVLLRKNQAQYDDAKASFEIQADRVFRVIKDKQSKGVRMKEKDVSWRLKIRSQRNSTEC